MTDSSTFEVIALGVGNAFAAKRYPTSLLLLAGDQRVLVDCPEPFFRMCAEAEAQSGRRIDPADLDDIVLTHLHGDHANGLEALGFWRKFSVADGRIPRIHTSTEVAQGLWPRLAPVMGRAFLPDTRVFEDYELSDYFEVRSFEIGATHRIGEIEIRTRQSLHMIPTFGFVATYGGRSFGYSCDTVYEAEHIEFLKDCDLIFHETGTGFHTPIEDLEALPEELRARMRVIHLEDDFEESKKIASVEAGRVYSV